MLGSVHWQVRNGQLDKEAGELRDENAQLATECEKLRSDAAHGARVCLLSGSFSVRRPGGFVLTQGRHCSLL